MNADRVLKGMLLTEKIARAIVAARPLTSTAELEAVYNAEVERARERALEFKGHGDRLKVVGGGGGYAKWARADGRMCMPIPERVN